MISGLRKRVLAVVVLASVVGAGCAPAADEGIELSIATFGEFGYSSLLKEYEAAHPGIRIQNRVADFETHHKGIATQLAAGRGAADIVAIEEQYMPQFRQSADKFVDLNGFGAANLRDRWPQWKWEQGLANSGGTVMGLGTDMGGLAMCFRKDYFAQAGLPTERAAVAALWPTWEDYAKTGDLFSGKVPSAKFADSAGGVYTAILNQSPENFFSAKDDSFIADRNPALRRAFTIAGQIGAKGQTARVTPFTQPWNVAIKQGSFATIACPAWMLTQIQEAGGPENAGKWDVAAVPGGGGNNGGSFLTVPTQSKHQRAAYDLAKWLTEPAQEVRLFTESNILPSEPAAYGAPEVLGKTDPYFSGAPIGRIYAASADSLKPNYRGLKDAKVRPTFGTALGRVESGKQALDAAWDQAVTEARAAAS
ncbi:extracellular solute-binding protein [Amycolatopsis decaplanina]|uniref:Sugar binding protein n=1 Tax=Amycolatopsis decaplanina DSM 44594 TaxID=1284240 RepID=M2Y0C5_9PSEU|nr:extracellular solute-binding protein [Amycolatopsis decaplanina]EME54980.1 sugar binding protein [Amycolatopsis decaplanina DSM 44594]